MVKWRQTKRFQLFGFYLSPHLSLKTLASNITKLLVKWRPSLMLVGWRRLRLGMRAKSRCRGSACFTRVARRQTTLVFPHRQPVLKTLHHAHWKVWSSCRVHLCQNAKQGPKQSKQQSKNLQVRTTWMPSRRIACKRVA